MVHTYNSSYFGDRNGRLKFKASLGKQRISISKNKPYIVAHTCSTSYLVGARPSVEEKLKQKGLGT
jgi:hypothetical protein